MKSKKLLISLMVITMVVVVIVVLAAVLTVKTVYPVYHGFDEGEQIAAPSDGIPQDELTAAYKGKGIVFLSKSKVQDELNAAHADWHVVGVVKQFPNVLEIHFVRRVTFAKMQISDATMVYLDNFGYVTNEPSDTERIVDITSAFQNKDIQGSATPGTRLVFQSAESNTRLGYVLDALKAVWMCYVEPSEIPSVLGTSNVFAFDDNGSLVLTPVLKGRIVVPSPEASETSLVQRIITALSVYYNGSLNLHEDGFEITVSKTGTVTSNNPN